MEKKRPTAKYRAYVLRTCLSDLTSHEGFQWPEKGYVEAPDWNPRPYCGNGLHGALWGEGNGGLFFPYADAKWLVVEVDERTTVDLGGKVKFPYGWVVYCGDRKGATDRIRKLGARGAVIGASVTVGDGGTVYVGYAGIATAGHNGAATAGDYGTATAGDCGTATAGYRGTASVGNRGKATVDDGGTATAGFLGEANAGHSGSATAGDHGTATAKSYGIATAGYLGTAAAGSNGRVAAGDLGLLRLDYYNFSDYRCRTAVAHVGEYALGPNGTFVVQPNQKYRLLVSGNRPVYWVPVEESEQPSPAA